MKITQKKLRDLGKLLGMSADEVKETFTKDEIIQQGINAGLWVHEEKPKPEETTPEETTPEETTPEETTPEETTPEVDSYNELIKKIQGGAGEAPPQQTTEPEKKKGVTIEKKKRQKRESAPDSFRVEGYILLLVMDTVFPFAFSFVNNMFDKRVNVQSNELQLTDKQMSKLEPLADQAADFLSVQLNPVVGFVLVSGFMYTNNLLTIRTIKTMEHEKSKK